MRSKKDAKNVPAKTKLEALTNVNFLNISQHFEFRGRQEHHQLKFGDFKIVSTSAGKYLEWSMERLRKISANERKFNPKMWATNHEERCPVMYQSIPKPPIPPGNPQVFDSR